MAAHRRSLSPGALALLTLFPAAVPAGTPAALRDAAPATAPWWPPTLSDSLGGAPQSGWAMSELGPMFMPAALNAMVYGPPTAMTPGPKLQKILAKVWEHLASRVEDLEGMERRAGLLEEEVAALERRPIGSSQVLATLEGSLATLRSHAKARAQELEEKFRQVQGFRRNLRQRFPSSRVPLREFFGALEDASEKVDDRYRDVGRVLTKIRERIDAMQKLAAKDDRPWRPSNAPEIPPGAARQPTADEIRERMAALRSERTGMRPAEIQPAVARVSASAGGAPTDWDSSWEQDVRQPVREPVPVARASGDPIEGWESDLASPGVDALYAGSSPAAGPSGGEDVGSYSSARDLIRARYERLKARAASGASTDELEREIRSRRPGDPVPPGAVPERLGPPQPVDGEELLEDFLEEDTVMDPYLSKAVGTLRAPDQVPGAGDPQLTGEMKQLLARGRTPGGATVRAAPKVDGLGNFATRLEHELELAARTEGLDDRASFKKPRRAKVPLPTGSRSVASIMAELEALDEE